MNTRIKKSINEMMIDLEVLYNGPGFSIDLFQKNLDAFLRKLLRFELAGLISEEENTALYKECEQKFPVEIIEWKHFPIGLSEFERNRLYQQITPQK